MNFRGTILLLSIGVTIIIGLISAPGCANIIPPQGGLKDTIPPILEKANPKDSALNFTGNKITFVFDEFIELQDWQRNLVITPIPQNNPEVTSKLNTVTIKFKDSLESNTTYFINFGNAIQDVTEKNILKDFSYLFSTGKALDSLEFSGKIIIAEDGKIDTNMTVMLHKNGKDSAVVTEKPRYVTKVNKKGEFTFHNLPSATYYIYAIKTEGSSYRYFGKQLFAFADKPITVGQKNEPVTLYAFTEKEEEKKKPATTTSVSGRGRAGIGAGADKRLKYQTTLKEGKQDLLSNFNFKFETPLKFFDSTKISISTDTTYDPLTEPFRWKKDSTNTTVELITEWKENTRYNIIFETDFAEDTSDHRILKKDTLNFYTREKKSYSELKLTFLKLELDKNPVLQFIQNNAVVLSHTFTSNEYTSNLFNPGEYELRILLDENKNGIWDTGEFFGKRKQPELVKPIERKITVKANWENEFDIAL
jgi:hypothetical protein